MLVDNAIDRRSGMRHEDFILQYLLPLRPVIITDAIRHWPALGRWTPDFFKVNHGDLQVRVDGKEMPLHDLIDQVMASSPSQPAPYLRNQKLSEWPKELHKDISPMPDCTEPNWLASALFPSRVDQTYKEIFIGGPGARFHVLHYDGYHTHAFLMQVFGDKEYVAYAPDQTPFVYPNTTSKYGNESQVGDGMQPDLAKFPLFDKAQGIRFQLHAGETLFVPSGWWHTARILSPSITVSINGANQANWANFKKDYCASMAASGWSLKSKMIGAVLSVMQVVLPLVELL